MPMKSHELLLEKVQELLPLGAVLRPVQPEVDAVALVKLVNADAAHVGNPIRDSADDIMEELTHSDVDVARALVQRRSARPIPRP